MFTKTVRLAVIAAMLGGAPIPALASDLGAAIVGGIIGGAIMNGAGQQRKRTYRSTTSSATRQMHAQSQVALNYFGFNAGSADGVMGSRSRAAVSNYQVFMGWPGTGHLQTMERDLLIGSYNRAQVGGPEVVKAMQRDPQGVRGLLLTWRDERMGINGQRRGGGYAGLPIEVSDAVDEIADSSEPSAEQLLQRTGFIQLADLNNDGRNDYVIDTAVTGSNFWCGQSQCAVLVFASQPDGYRRNDFRYQRNPQLTNTASPTMFQCHQSSCAMKDPLAEGGTQMVAAPAPAPAPTPAQPPVVSAAAPAPAPASGLMALPMAAPAPADQPSLASYCSKVNLLTSSNGGFVTAAAMSDPDLALSEQFCLTRTYAIARGEDMLKAVQGLSITQVEQQCDAFGPALAPFVAALKDSEAAQVLQQVQKFVLSANMTVEQLQSTGAICLYTGYRRDKLDVALGAALLLTGAGQQPYAELVGHHLGQGFGAEASMERARGWYQQALSALDGGAAPVFAPNQPERIELVRAALNVGDKAQGGNAPQQTSLPSFLLK
ncbi:peptidoglycan-binding domain-containing protein [Pseudooceanicola sp.]|uniref:peptidoglycan-binding domain-containing protein n=1 Tax=Pseudooceanicola sp. TaxID=1914328 RepID=UPI00262D5281|nr:peptidoglycan-binding domain-containing protein [Pseudooceanicola sp.]MDF1854832.1 peptidoglycan-binding domain-containing protein [Pseudooceanicola sp.]